MPHVTPSFWQRLANAPRERQAIAFLRMATGLFFLYVGYEKLHNPDFPVLMAQNLKTWASSNPILIYQALLETVVLPNGLFFSKLIAYGEMTIGVSYLTGLFLRYTAPFALFLNLNFLLATQHTGTAALGINLAFILIHLSLWWGQAGCCYGLDALLPAPTAGRRKKTTSRAPSNSASPRIAKSSHRLTAKPSHSGGGKGVKKLKNIQHRLEKQAKIQQAKSMPSRQEPSKHMLSNQTTEKRQKPSRSSEHDQDSSDSTFKMPPRVRDLRDS